MRFSLASVNFLLRHPVKSKPGEYFSAGKATGYARSEAGLADWFFKSDWMEDGIGSIFSNPSLMLEIL
jgi:hypothetical protein